MKKLICVLAAVLCLLSVTFITAFAIDGSVVYDGDAAKFIFSPGTKYSLTDLFPNFKDVMPGDTLNQTITVNNKASNHVKVKIYLRALGSHDEKSEAFLSQLHLSVTKVKDTVMFDAAADQKGGLEDWVCLGTLYSGGKVDLNVTLDVPSALDNTYQKQIGCLDWEFKVEEYEIEEGDPESVFTGSNTVLTLWLPLATIAVCSAIVLFLRRKIKAEKAVNR